MMNLGDDFVPHSLDVANLPFSCQWIISLLNKAVTKVNGSLEAMNLSSVGTAVHSWWLYQLCDVFIEISKPVLLGDNNNPKAFREKRFKVSRHTLWVCLHTGLRLLHPFMPFLTEELWQRLPQRARDAEKSSIVMALYPKETKEWENVEVKDRFPVLESVVRSARSMRMTYGVQSK